MAAAVFLETKWGSDIPLFPVSSLSLRQKWIRSPVNNTQGKGLIQGHGQLEVGSLGALWWVVYPKAAKNSFLFDTTWKHHRNTHRSHARGRATELLHWVAILKVIAKAVFSVSKNYRGSIAITMSKIVLRGTLANSWANVKDSLQIVVKALIRKANTIAVSFQMCLIMPLQVGEARNRVKITNKQCIFMLNLLGLLLRAPVSLAEGMPVVYFNQVRYF